MTCGALGSPVPRATASLCPPRGSAIAKIAGSNTARLSSFESQVNMWVLEEEVGGRRLTDIINTEHENVKYLPGHKLPPNVVSVGCQQPLRGAELTAGLWGEASSSGGLLEPRGVKAGDTPGCAGLSCALLLTFICAWMSRSPGCSHCPPLPLLWHPTGWAGGHVAASELASSHSAPAPLPCQLWQGPQHGDFGLFLPFQLPSP